MCVCVLLLFVKNVVGLWLWFSVVLCCCGWEEVCCKCLKIKIKSIKKKRKELILIGSHALCAFPEMHIALHCDCETTLMTGGVFCTIHDFLASRHQLSLSPPSGSWSPAGSTACRCRRPTTWPAPGRRGRSRRPRRRGGGPGRPPAGSGRRPPPATTAWRCGPGSPTPAACRWATRPRCWCPAGGKSRGVTQTDLHDRADARSHRPKADERVRWSRTETDCKHSSLFTSSSVTSLAVTGVLQKGSGDRRCGNKRGVYRL